MTTADAHTDDAPHRYVVHRADQLRTGQPRDVRAWADVAPPDRHVIEMAAKQSKKNLIDSRPADLLKPAVGAYNALVKQLDEA